MIGTVDIYQQMIKNAKRYHKGNIFNWQKIPKEYVEMIENTKIYNWLYPIKFNFISALIIEEIQANVEGILDKKDIALKRVYANLNMSKEGFNNEIKGIQELLIKLNKAKLCKNGRIIIMNEI